MTASRATRILGAFVLGAALPFAGCGDGDEPSPPPASPSLYDADGRPTGAVPRPPGPPSLVLVVIDTLRADRLDLRRADGGRMPFLASLAKRGTVFTEATAHAPWTPPSIASLLTGLLPSQHLLAEAIEDPRLSAAIPTFAEVLANGCGYQTAAYSVGLWMGGRDSLLQGFESPREGFSLQGMEALVLPWARARDPEKPFFLLLHTFDAHDPYGAEDHPFPENAAIPAEGWHGPFPEPRDLARIYLTDREGRHRLGRAFGPRSISDAVRYFHVGFAADPQGPALAAEMSEAYDEGVSWVDGLLETAVRRLEEWGLLENALLVVTGDHGEAFGEHGLLWHGRDLHDELLRVPLVLSGIPPFEGGRVVTGAVGLADILPTFFDLAGLAPPPEIEGRSFLPLVRGEAAERPVISEAHRSPGNTSTDEDAYLVSVRTSRRKQILSLDRRTGAVRERAYDLRADPGEVVDLLAGGAASSDIEPEFREALERARALVSEERARRGFPEQPRGPRR